MQQVIINGVLTSAEKAFVSIDERGFRFGDGVFETIPVFAGVPYLWEYHMGRLEAGLAALHIRCTTHDLLAESARLIEVNQVKDAMVRIYVSRGIGSRGYLPSPATSGVTTVVQTLERLPASTEAVTLWLSSYERISPRALPTHCKLAQGVNATLVRMEAAGHNCHDALQLSAEGYIAETSSANIGWLAGGKFYTPSLACGVLAGVTRRRMTELSPYQVHEGSYGLTELLGAEAVVLMNASQGVVPVETLSALGVTWESHTLAQEFNRRRQKDIADYTRNLREILAQS